jgi:peroxiredoxin
MNKHNKSISLMPFFLAILLVLTLQVTINAESKNTLQKSTEVKAPDFVLQDIKGHKFKLSDYKGKPVLIIFSTTWCGYCRAEIPHFKEIYSSYMPSGLEVVNVDINESKEKVARFTAHYQLPYRVVLDEDGTVADNYYVRGVPSITLIDQKGYIVCLYCHPVEPSLDKLFEKTKNTGKK